LRYTDGKKGESKKERDRDHIVIIRLVLELSWVVVKP